MSSAQAVVQPRPSCPHICSSMLMKQFAEMAKREPDKVLEHKTLDNQAILYRIPSGDNNPLHVDPDFAKMAGFEKPILHGLCTYGITCKKIMESDFENNPLKVSEVSAIPSVL